jgi:hypothetical protein
LRSYGATLIRTPLLLAGIAFCGRWTRTPVAEVLSLTVNRLSGNGSRHGLLANGWQSAAGVALAELAALALIRVTAASRTTVRRLSIPSLSSQNGSVRPADLIGLEDERLKQVVRATDVRRGAGHNNGGVRTISRPLRWLAFLIPLTAAIVVVVFVVHAGPRSFAARLAVVVLAVVQLGSLPTMRRRPERSMAVALAAGVGLQALWPDLGTLGLANLSMCALAALRPPRVSLWALGFMLALAPWPAATRGAVAGLIAAGGPVISWSWGELLRTR